jgi:tRNA pseudouridine55 synthase
VDGIININKPSGMTSFAVVARVRYLSHEKRVGHSGTLDPLATGVLPVYLGQATRIIEYVTDTSKTYRAEIEFGKTTTTFDAEGDIVNRTDAASLNLETLIATIGKFIGEISQVPPVFSAIKQNGTPLYRLARAGAEVKPQARKVKIEKIDILAWDSPIATIEVECAKGTYIRSLAHDLGQETGFGAYLKSLVRTRCGVFNLADAVTLDELTAAFASATYSKFFHPTDYALDNLPKVEVDTATATDIRNGTSIALPCIPTDKYCRLYDSAHMFTAILKFDSEIALWHPQKVFRSLDTAKSI